MLAPAPPAELVPTPAEMVEQFLPLARRIARRFARNNRRLADDFDSAAQVALWRAAERYDPTRGMSPKTHVTGRVVFACRDVIREAQRRRRRDGPQVLPNEEGVTPLDEAHDRRPDRADAIDLADLLDTLPPDDRVVVAQRLDGETFEQIGQAKGRTAASVQWQFRKAARQFAGAMGC